MINRIIIHDLDYPENAVVKESENNYSMNYDVRVCVLCGNRRIKKVHMGKNVCVNCIEDLKTNRLI